jgi:plasmid maintenance system antidote protein VapI
VAETSSFKEGLDRVIRGAREYRIALMCAERDPLACHRSLLVARELERREATVSHILGDGRTELHDAAIERLLRTFDLAQPDMFRTKEERIDLACFKQAERIAYVDDELREAARG